MNDRSTVRRSRAGSPGVKLLLAVATLGLAELAIIGALIVLPMMTVGSVEIWQGVLCAVLLTITSATFVATCFVRTGGKWRWRWTER